jgi:hypothetical protein
MAYIYSLVDTWNDGATTFKGIGLNVTDSASAAASLLMDLQVGGVSQLSMSKSGTLTVGNAGGGGGLKITNAGSFQPVLSRNNDGGLILGFIGGTALPVYFGSNDVALARDAANTLAQRNGVNAQAFNLYNTYTDASNYERGYKRFVSNVFDIGTEAAGTGTVRNVQIKAGTQTWVFNANGGTTFPANSISVLSSFAIGRAPGVLTLFNESQSSGAAFEYVEQTAPTAPVTNRVRVYAEDNGSGKTRLMALFPTGAAVQIAIEP